MNLREELVSYSVNPTTWDNVWQTLKSDCKYLTDWGVATLSDGLRQSVKSIIMEPHYVCKDHRNLYSNFYSKKFLPTSPFTKRLHFFSEADINLLTLLRDPKAAQKAYLGYSVIRPVWERCLGRTVIDPMRLATTDRSTFFSLTTEFEAHIAGLSFKVKGYPYMSQDGDVTVCAHTALWSVCRYLSQRYTLYRELYPFDFIEMTEHSHGRTFPYRGMTYLDYSSILSQFGVYPLVLWLRNDQDKPDPDEHANLYSYVESGFPIIASYLGHVVTIVGHTLDFECQPTPDPDGFVNSLEFVKQYVVVDDNYFPYQLLGRIPSSKYSGWRIDDIVTAVCPLPEKVFLPAEHARRWALEYLKGYKAQLESTGESPFVTRLFLTSSTAFKRRCLQRSQLDGSIDVLSLFPIELNLPHFIWIMEAGPIALFRQGKCTAEVVLDPTANNVEYPAIYMRIGKTLFFEGHTIDTDSPLVYSQYTHNLGEK